MIENIVLDETDGNHTYRYYGGIVPGVNEILKAVGVSPDFDKVPKIEKYRVFGKRVHKMTALYDKGILDEKQLSEPFRPYLQGWKNLHKDHKIKWKYIEVPRYHRTLGYAGQPDRVGMFDTLLIIGDIKTKDETQTIKISLANKIQIHAYGVLCEDDGLEIEDKIIIQLGIGPRGYTLRHCNEPDGRNQWMSCANVYQMQQIARRPIN